MTKEQEYTKKLRDVAVKVLNAPTPGERSSLVDTAALRELLLIVQKYEEPKE